VIYIQVFYEFFITGLFIFGGGLASIPFFQQMGENYGWFTTVELMDIIAVSEAAPGPIGVNIATYIGYKVAGIPGGVIATFGMVLPSIVIALIIARLLVSFKESTIVKSALYGLRPASLGLIAAAGIAVFCLVVFGTGLRSLTMSHLLAIDYKVIILAAILFFATNKYKKIHPIAFLAISAAAGIFIL